MLGFFAGTPTCIYQKIAHDASQIESDLTTSYLSLSQYQQVKEPYALKSLVESAK